jgi:LuxR family transcriptional regulator, maltose regulon positive regulatory protein
LDAVAISRYRHRAATILEEAGDLEQALILFLEVGDADAATRLILSQAQELTAAGRYATLRELIERLPPAALQKNPWMLYWRGISSFLFAPVESARDFAQAYERFEERNDVTGLLLAWSGVVDAVWHQQTDWKQLDPWISRLEAQLHPDWEFPSNEVAARVISSLFWVLLWHRPTHPKMAHWAEEAARLWERADEFSIRLRLGVGLCSYYLLVAEASRFRTLGEPQRQLARRKDVSPDAALLARLVSIYVSTYDGFYQEASERMREALEAASAAGIHVFDCLLYGAALYAALGREDLPAADQLLDSMGAVLVALPTNLDTGHYRLHGSWRARLVGDVRHAVQQAESAVEIAARIGAYYPEIMCRYGLAHAYLMGGDLAGAQRENGIARAKAQAANFNWWRHLCGLFDAYLAFERAEEMSGVERLREALALQERFDIGYLLPFWSKAMIARLCVKAFEHGVATDYVRKLLRVRRPDAAEVPLHLTTWPWPIKIYTLSSFAVLIDDKPLKFSTKAQRKPLDLLKVLIALGGRNVREDKLAEILWPDSEADSAAFALTTTVHRLRRLIGDAALERQEGCLNLDPRYCWVDVWAVEHQLAAIEEASRAAPPAAIAELVDRVLALYRGPFLADQREESWVLSMRERLRGRLLRVIGLASDALTGARHYAQAIQYLEKVLEIDPLVEHFHRSIMQVHLTQGHHAAALAAYRRCRKALTTHLGLEPSADTEALRRQIPTA